MNHMAGEIVISKHVYVRKYLTRKSKSGITMSQTKHKKIVTVYSCLSLIAFA